MGDATEKKGPPVFRTADYPRKKKIGAHSWDPDDLDWIDEQACKRGMSKSAFLREVVEEARGGQKAVPAILRGDARVIHLTSLNPQEGKVFMTSSGIYPGPGEGPPIGVPCDAEGKLSEFESIVQGLHAFDSGCVGCQFLVANSQILPGVYRGR